MRKSGRLGDILGIIGCVIIWIVGFVVIGYLFYLAGFSTSVINASEHTWLVEDSFWFNMLCGILVLGTVGFACRRVPLFRAFVQHINTDADFYRLCRKRLLIFLGGLCIVMLIVLQKIPVNDQRTICDIVNSMMNHDYYAFERGGYIDEYPNQLGVVLFLYGLAHIVGSYNYLFFQLLNAVALVVIYYTMSELSDWMGHSAFIGICILGAGLLFWPAILYATFVYGTLLGLCLSLRAFRNMLKLIWPDQNACRKRGSRLLLHKCILLVVVLLEAWMAVVLKQNYMINAVALIIMAVLLTMRQGKIVSGFDAQKGAKQTGEPERVAHKSDVGHRLLMVMQVIVLIVGLFIMLLFSCRVVTKAAEKVTGMDIGSGILPLSWVAMGLQENSVRYDGWYNGYNVDSYHEANSSNERQESIIKEYLQERIQGFAENPSIAIAFLAGKNASQWNNPDFQAFWCVNSMRSSTNYSMLINRLFSVKGVAIMDQILNRWQFVVLLGAVLNCVLGKHVRRRKWNGSADGNGINELESFRGKKLAVVNYWDPVPLYCITVLIGGFVFHSFWEAKAQYTFPYFLLLIPVAVYGFESFFSILTDTRFCQQAMVITAPEANEKGARGKSFSKCITNPAILAVLCLMLGGVLISVGGKRSGLLQTVFLRTEDTEQYHQYLMDHVYVRLGEEEYLISAAGSVSGAESQVEVTIHLSTSDYDEKCWIFTEDNQTFMADDGTIRYSGDKVFPLAVSGIMYSDEQSWYLRKNGMGDEYYLIHVVDSKELALTRNTDTGEMELAYYDGSANQRWRIVEKK